MKDFILASGSPQRKILLENIGYVPKKIESADIDESEKKKELPINFVKRMAREKALKVFSNNLGENVLGADTIVVVAGKILHKSNNDEEQLEVMNLLSGRPHMVITAVCLVDKSGQISEKVSKTKVFMKRLSNEEIKDYVATKEWVGCCGYKIEGLLEGFVRKIMGSYSGVVGLPLYETRNLLMGKGVL